MTTDELKRLMVRAGLAKRADYISTERIAEFWPPMTGQAVRAWKGTIPPLRVYQLRDSHPSLFMADRSEAA